MMGKHDDRRDSDGQGDYDHTKTKDPKDAGGGKHDKGDKR